MADPVIDSTHVALGTSNQPAPPYTSFSPGAAAVMANNEVVVGDLDEHSGKVWEAGTTEYITFGAVINNRNALSGATCYFENNNGITVSTQSANPNYPDDGYVFQLGSGPTSGNANGMASLYCDAIPVNGLARRQALNIWVNSNAGDSSHVARGTDIGTMYVDASVNTADSGSCGSGSSGKGTSATNPYSSITYASICGLHQLAGTVSATSEGFLVSVANNIYNSTATTGSSGTTVNLTANCPSAVVPTGNSNLQNYVLNDLTQGAQVGTVSSCATSGSALTLAASAAVTVSSGDSLQFQSPEGQESGACPGGICYGTSKQIDVYPANPAVAVTGIAAYSGTSATLTLSSRPSTWIAGTQVLITGMYPNEYNGYYTLLSVSGNTITFQCCTIGGQTGFSDPLAVHPSVTVYYGQAVVPYQLETATAAGNSLNTSVDAISSTAPISTGATCMSSACAAACAPASRPPSPIFRASRSLIPD